MSTFIYHGSVYLVLDGARHRGLECVVDLDNEMPEAIRTGRVWDAPSVARYGACAALALGQVPMPDPDTLPAGHAEFIEKMRVQEAANPGFLAAQTSPPVAAYHAPHSPEYRTTGHTGAPIVPRPPGRPMGSLGDPHGAEE